jgi:hypothetical protein
VKCPLHLVDDLVPRFDNGARVGQVESVPGPPGYAPELVVLNLVCGGKLVKSARQMISPARVFAETLIDEPEDSLSHDRLVEITLSLPQKGHHIRRILPASHGNLADRSVGMVFNLDYSVRPANRIGDGNRSELESTRQRFSFRANGGHAVEVSGHWSSASEPEVRSPTGV